MQQFTRFELLIGADSLNKLKNSAVIVFGLGGVGGNACEALARAGVGRLGLVDNDTFCLSNLNRQLFADHSTLGTPKTQAAENRLKLINPNIIVDCYNQFYDQNSNIDLTEYDYIVDAIDSLQSKICLITNAHNLGVPLVSCMGMGNKLDPTKIKLADIYQTHTCALAKTLRTRLKTLNIPSLKTVFTSEPATKQTEQSVTTSSPFVPPAAGLALAYQVVSDLIKLQNT